MLSFLGVVSSAFAVMGSGFVYIFKKIVQKLESNEALVLEYIRANSKLKAENEELQKDYEKAISELNFMRQRFER